MLDTLLGSVGKFLLTAAGFCGALIPLLGLSLLNNRDKQRRDESSSPPQEEKLLRPPGYSLSLKIDKLSEELIDHLPWLLGAGGISAIFLLESLVLFLVPERRVLGLAFFTCAIAIGYLAVQKTASARVVLRKRRDYQLGLRGEQAVAESLSELAAFGYRTFHDLPGGENWNIDHIVVGPQGVFVIETKARRRQKVAPDKPSHVVNYDAERLVFPTFEDRKAIPQTRRNAQWIANYLTKKTGETVEAQPIVAIPGWYVVCSAADTGGIAAMNATYLKKYLSKQPNHLPPAQVRRIITALEEKCRDIEF